jgi:hypothetical protein
MNDKGEADMKKMLLTVASVTLLGCGAAHAVEGTQAVQGTFGRLDHVFFIIMENQTNTDILGNAYAPFINAYAKSVNQATNYFAVGHPSLPNYLEINGGSNFGVTGDFWPNWGSGSPGCIDNSPGSTGCVGSITPINSIGLDNTVVETATPGSSACNGQIGGTGTAVPMNCALRTYVSTAFTPKSIANQLVARGKTWKTYQESLPAVEPGVYGVNYADGELSNLSPASVFNADGTTPPPVTTPVQKLYAVKHNPFVYFDAVQRGENPRLSLEQVVDFDGPNGLWADLQSDHAPNYSYIVPNQCHDMHGGVSGGTPICSTKTATESSLLIQQGDAEVSKLINGIKASKAWNEKRSVIVLTWDENDYSNAANRVVMLVETNYAANGIVDANNYDHFSLLRTIEAGFGLPCLNHACDVTSVTMNAMFGGH